MGKAFHTLLLQQVSPRPSLLEDLFANQPPSNQISSLSLRHRLWEGDKEGALSASPPPFPVGLLANQPTHYFSCTSVSISTSTAPWARFHLHQLATRNKPMMGNVRYQYSQQQPAHHHHHHHHHFHDHCDMFPIRSECPNWVQILVKINLKCGFSTWTRLHGTFFLSLWRRHLGVLVNAHAVQISCVVLAYLRGVGCLLF